MLLKTHKDWSNKEQECQNLKELLKTHKIDFSNIGRLQSINEENTLITEQSSIKEN